MAKKRTEPISVDQILEEVEKEEKKEEKKSSSSTPATLPRAITKIEEQKIISDVKKAIKEGDVTFTKIKVYAIKNGEEYFINEYKYEEEAVLDPEGWIKKRVLDNLPEEYLTDTFVIKAILPDGKVGFEQTVRVAVPKKRNTIDDAISNKVKEVLELSSIQTQSLLNMIKEMSQKGNENAQVVQELIRIIEDMINQLKEAKEKAIEDIKRAKEEEGKAEREILQEIIAIEKMFDEKIEKLLMIVNMLEQKKGSEEATMLVQLIPQLLEKLTQREDSFEKFAKILELTERFKQEDSFKENLLNMLIEKALKEEEKKEDPIDKLMKEMEVLAKLKEIFAPKDDNNNSELLVHMLVEKIEELEKRNMEMIQKLLEDKKEKKDEWTEFLETFEKMKRIKKFMEEITGQRPQPAKSMVELIAQIINSPVIKEVATVIADALVKQELIRQGVLMQGNQLIVLPTAQGFGGALPPTAPQQPTVPVPPPQPQAQPKQKKEEQADQKTEAKEQKKRTRKKSSSSIEEAKKIVEQAIDELVKKMKAQHAEYKEATHEQFVAMLVTELVTALATNKKLVEAIKLLAQAGEEKYLNEIILSKIKEAYSLTEEQVKRVEADVKKQLGVK